MIKSTAFLLLFAMAACQQPENKQAPAEMAPAEQKAEPMAAAEEKPGLVQLVMNKMDPVCGMPVTAGVSDTLTHEGKILGFCAPECKEEFAKNPKDFKVEYKN